MRETRITIKRGAYGYGVEVAAPEFKTRVLVEDNVREILRARMYLRLVTNGVLKGNAMIEFNEFMKED